jgi:formylglycine-generating enzyme required for sulfatase activity
VARIFLCHASEDKAQVREVYHRLQTIDGFEPWLDEEDLLPGQEWAREIPRALQASDFILIFLSRTSVAKRGYVQREMKLALDTWQELPEGTIHTIPVRIDDCEVPESFRRYHWANLFEPNGFDRIVRAIRAELTKRQGTEPEPSTFTNSISMEFVLIPTGTFMMGSPYSDTQVEDKEKPAHRVTISQLFYLGKYPVTQGQWEAVMGTNPSHFTGDQNRPVERVSWEDTQEYIRRLNTRESSARYRLPTEAEWEYACRAGSTPRSCFGDNRSQLGVYGWYDNNSRGMSHPVGQRKPNAWGLHDMHGNVWEWVQDWYGAYDPEPVTDPQGLASGSHRVVRGGSWHSEAGGCRSAYRSFGAPSDRYDFVGFRCACSGRRK